MISQELLDILGCPACENRPGLVPESGDDGDFLACAQCGRRYPVRDNIPAMLVDEALPPRNHLSKRESKKGS